MEEKIMGYMPFKVAMEAQGHEEGCYMVILNKVLLVGTKTSTYIGYPIVQNAVIHAVVEEQGLNDKVIVFKFKKKKGYERNIGHRQPNTRLRIIGITGYENSPAVTLP
ncbi:50S ribosomal protein [Actinidia chinensis var. chinensis]|uniref:50S ribosomal protein n=1 Tax=Actinidia chinensis var. chinensis TaxID=1590841 RepID=A0A2R6P1G3_ACTCC|nr:50S ribosomal protein [Actinidia chinensis var. chinensis]